MRFGVDSKQVSICDIGLALRGRTSHHGTVQMIAFDAYPVQDCNHTFCFCS